MRRGFDSLCGIIENELGQNALSGDVFIFVNRWRTHIKLLSWERDGFGLYYKRLEKGTYELPVFNEKNGLDISTQQLILMLHGISLKQVKYRKRYSHSECKCG